MRRRSPGQLAHANICQIFELGRIDGSHFIAMEYIWGKDLLQIQNRLRKIKQQMPIPMACFIDREGARGPRLRAPQARSARPPARDRAPRLLAAERARVVRGRGQGHRLRHREGDVAQLAHDGRRAQGQVRLHVARAGARPAARSPQRHLRARHDALRVPDRRAPVPGRDRLLDAREGPQRRHPPPRAINPDDPRGRSSA